MTSSPSSPSNSSGTVGSVKSNGVVRGGGLKEGVARALSQACTYGMDLQKSFLQVHGKTLNLQTFFQVLYKGMVQSSLTSGVVYASYFSVYNALQPHPAAGVVAAVTNAIIKIPISNSMRVMQTNPSINNVFKAGRKIHRNHGVRGLYTGLGMSLSEDIIEWDLRIRLHAACSQAMEPFLPSGPQRGLVAGAISGATAAALTTPFDTMRAIMAAQSATTRDHRSALQTLHGVVHSYGPQALFRGYELRAVATGIKMALFYMFMEMM